MCVRTSAFECEVEINIDLLRWRFQVVIIGKLLTANDELSSVSKYTEGLCTSGPINRKGYRVVKIL